MRVVDFSASPERAELGEELRQAFDELNLAELVATDPTDEHALLGVGFPDRLSGDEVVALAEELRVQLAALLTGGPIVRFELAGQPR